MKLSKLTNIFLATFAGVVLLIVGAGCSSQRKAVAPAQGRVPPKRTQQVASLAETYKPWRDVYMPFNCRIAQPMGVNLSGRATMVAGECIYLSLRVLGMEVGQVWIDRDSAFVAEKLGKTLVAEPLGRLTARTGLDINDLQALLLGQAFYPGTGALRDPAQASGLFSVVTDNGTMTMTPRRTPAGVTWYFTVNDALSLTGLVVEPDGYKPFTAKFGDPAETGAGRIATSVEVQGSLGAKNVQASVFWNASKSEWDRGASPSKPDWRGYRRMDARKMLDNMKF